MNNRANVRQLIQFVIDQKLDISQYDDKLLDKIYHRFYVTDRSDSRPGFYSLMTDLILWESGQQKASLEVTLSEKYLVAPKPAGLAIGKTSPE